MRVRKDFIFRTRIRYFGHGNIIKYSHRPFLCDYDLEILTREGAVENGKWKPGANTQRRISEESIEMMDEAIINNINHTVGEKDEFFLLGDFCYGIYNDLQRKAREYRDRINCQNIYLIWGNHDNRKVLRDLFSATYDLYNLHVGNQLIVLCHYAMAIWDKSHRGSIHLYGHSHADAENWLDSIMPGRKSMDVGVDNAAKILGSYRPFTEKEIFDIMKTRTGVRQNHP